MNAYSKAVDLGLTTAAVPGSDPERGYTPAEIVGILQTLTVSDISVAKVRSWFRDHNLWLERSTGGMMGPLHAAYQSASEPQKDGLDYLYDAVFKKSAEHLRTTDPVWSMQVKALVDLVVQLSPQASGLVDSFYALDGGRPWLTLTVEQYEAQRIAAEDAAALVAIREATKATQQAVITPLQSKLNAIDAWLATEAALAMTPTEYQAYADALLATDDGNPPEATDWVADTDAGGVRALDFDGVNDYLIADELLASDDGNPTGGE